VAAGNEASVSRPDAFWLTPCVPSGHPRSADSTGAAARFRSAAGHAQPPSPKRAADHGKDAGPLRLKQIVLLTLVTLVPALELRASIPYGILVGSPRWGITPGLMPWWMVVGVCIAANTVLGMAVFWVMGPAMRLAQRSAWFRRRVCPLLAGAQRRVKPYLDKYGLWGVAVFIGVPLPGSGVYTGAVGSFLLGMDRRRFAVANLLGVLMAAAIVTAITLGIKAGIELPWLDWAIKKR